MIAVAGGALGGLGGSLEGYPVFAGLKGFELVRVAGTAERGDLLAAGHAIGRGMAAGVAVLLARAMAGITSDALGEVGVGFNIGGGLGVALLAELVCARLLRQKE
jgi:hypothetical protein